MNKLWMVIQPKILLFARLSKKQQYLSYAVIILVSGVVGVFLYYQTSSEYQQKQSIQQQLSSKLAHQKKIIQSLQKKSQQQLLTPALAKQLLPVNQKIKQLLLPSIELKSSQWEMAQSPLLKLNLEGDFLSLRYFLFQLLDTNNQLRLVNCQFVKVFNSESEEMQSEEIESEILTQEDFSSVKPSANGLIESEILLQLKLL